MVHKPALLVVEDDREIRESLCELLLQEGFEVRTASNGEEALVMLREQPDVRAIVLDMVMPVMNGATFRGEQLADPRIASIPTILLTGRDDSMPLARALGAAACVRKPFTPEALLEVLSRYR